jgi:hypothetical protein
MLLVAGKSLFNVRIINYYYYIHKFVWTFGTTVACIFQLYYPLVRQRNVDLELFFFSKLSKNNRK